MAEVIVEDHWPAATAAKMFMCSEPTARKWARRFREEGEAGMPDRSSRPRLSPTKTPPPVVQQIVCERWRRRLGPVQIGGRPQMPASTVHAALVRCRLNRLSRIDRVTGEPIRRCEHPHPGSMMHVDVTKFGNILDGGGHRFVVRQQSKKNAQTTAERTAERGKTSRPKIGTALQADPVLPEGLIPQTARLVAQALESSQELSAAECAEQIGVSRVSARRYLEYFVDQGTAIVRLNYGSAGRPRRRYRAT